MVRLTRLGWSRMAVPVLALWAAAAAWAGPIQTATTQLYIHADGVLVDVLDQTSPSYFSTIDVDGYGTYGWVFPNYGVVARTNLSLIAFLDADIDRDDNTFFNEYGAFIGLTQPPSAPVGSIAASAWEIDEPGFLYGDILSNINAGLLDNSNGVPSDLPDDVSLGLQFLIGSLDPGLAATVRLFISETNINGLQQVDPDSGRSFFFNGYAGVDFAPPPPPGGEIPEPATWTLMLVAGGLAVVLRKLTRTDDQTRRSMQIIMALLFPTLAMSQSQPLVIKYDGFTNANGLSLNGAARTVSTQNGVVLRLARASGYNGGSAFSSAVVNFKDFSTYFRFRFSNLGGVSTTGADGITFAIQPISSSIGGVRAGLGIGGVSPSVAVEFDIYRNGHDPDNSHAAFIINGQIWSHIGLRPVLPLLQNGNVKHLWIDYNGQVLEMRISEDPTRPADAFISIPINIPSIINRDVAFVGFTGATGAAWADHDILYWEHSTVYSPRGLPDLKPTEIAIAQQNIPSSVVLRSRITNGETSSNMSSTAQVSFYRGDPATGGTLLGTTQTTKPLGPGEFEDVSITWNNPPAGTHPIVVVVDPENLIAEGDETNNKAGTTITLGAGPATLVDSVISRFKNQSADVIWARVPDAASYRVYRRTQGGVPQQVRAGLTGTSFTDTGLTNGTTYFYTVRWVNAQGVESPDGTEASATPTPTGSAGNTPPSILSYLATRGRTGNPYSYQLRAGDPDAGEVLTYSLLTPPAGMTISPTGRITWAPEPAQAGAHRINVRVQDRTNRFATQSYTLYVDTVLVNNPPAFISQPISSAQTGVQYAYQARAIDPDAGDLLTYSLTTAPQGMSINGAGLITWTPLIAQVGAHPVAVRVRDLLGLEATQSFAVTVTRLNRPPQILSQAPATGRVGTLYTYQVAATDPDLGAGDTLTFSLQGPPAGMTISPTGLIQWMPAQQGALGATVRVTDSAGLTASQTFTVNVLPANQPPVITSVAPLNASVGGLYTYAAVATDPDGDALTWSLVQGPTGLTIQPTTGLVAWTPTTSQQSAHPVTIRVQDSLGAGVNQSFTITVGPADNTKPTVTILTPASGTSLNADVTVTGTVTDDNLQEWKLSYRVPGEANWIRFASGTTNVTSAALGSFRAGLLANNPYRILLEARDAAGNSDSQEIEVLVDSGDLKLGDFSITFTDMTIPGLGLPVAIQRTYDTKQPQTGDFGPHWSLGFSGVYLRRDVNFNVFATLPSGRRMKFNYTPVGIGLGVFNTRWTAESGTYDTLENTDCPQVLGPPPTPLCQGFQAWNPQNWILRTKEGFTYYITSGGGIRRMEDRNSNWMEITSTGVTTNTGQNIPFVRDAQGRLIEIGEPSPSPGKFRYEYDAEGRLSAFLDPAGATTRFRYQNNSFPNYLTAIDDPLGRPVMRNLYDEAGRLIAQCDANGNPTTLAGCVRFDPNISTRTQTIYTARGFRTDLILDTRGNILNERRYTNSTQFLETVRTYDASNNLLTERDPAGNLKTFTYSARGNRLTETDPGGRTTTYTYNACDKVATETDPAGQTTTYTYDSACRLTEVRNALNHVTRYAYNSNGQRTEFTDANGNTWTWAYNAQGFLTSLTDPFGKPTSFTFNSTGDLLSRTDRLGRRIDFQYDSAHRMTRETWNTGRVTTYAYDTAGQLIVAMDPDSTLSMSYDANGRLRTVDNQGTPGVPRVVMTYGYDANGNVTQVADSLGGVTDYSYDGLDRLARVAQSGTGVQPKRVDMEYDGASLLRAMRRFSNLTGTAAVANTLYEYECGGCPARLSAIRHRRASDNGVIHDLTYTRDALGNITQMIDADGTHHYTYDAIRRLLTASHSNTGLQPNEFYNLDPMGNRITSHLSNTHLYQRNRLIEDQQHTYLYDDEGNQVRKTVKATGAYTEYIYDHRNRMTTVIERTSSGTETARHTYAFDAINRRIRANEAGTQAAWAYDGLNPALKMTPTGTMISRRMYSRNLDQVVADQDPIQTRWFMVDQVRSTRDLVSNGAGVLQRYV